jgi:two-component system invasion response regulator UvrY
LACDGQTMRQTKALGGIRRMRVLIVDDHPIVVSGCRALLGAEPAIEVVDAADGEAGYLAYFAEQPDVAVIDINLPGVSGLEVCRRILQRDPQARLIIFSMNDDPIFAVRAIEAGAKGYIAKNDDPLLFADAVRRVAAGDVYLRPEMAREVAFIRVGSGSNPLSQLNARDLEILRLLAAGNSMAQIAHVLNVSYKTVANNCTALKHKLGARSAMDLMRIAVDSSISPNHKAR